MANELTQFDALKADITTYVAPTMDVHVSSFETSATAIDAGKRIKALKDAIEKKRKELVSPLNDRVKAINEYARKIAEPLEHAESHLKFELLTFEREQERIRMEEKRRLEAEKAAALAKLEAEAKAQDEAASIFGGDAEPAPEETVEVKRAVLEGEFAGREWDINDSRVKNTRRTWKFEVIDPKALPAEFLMPNEKAIKAAVTNGRRDIPGVKCWQEANISFGSKTSVSRAAIEKESTGVSE